MRNAKQANGAGRGTGSRAAAGIGLADEARHVGDYLGSARKRWAGSFVARRRVAAQPSLGLGRIGSVGIGSVGIGLAGESSQ